MDNHNNQNKNAALAVPFIVAFVIICVFMGIASEFSEEISIWPIVSAVIFFVFLFTALIIVTVSQKKKIENGTAKSDYNHNKTFHKSEWERLGISPNDFKVDDGQYKKNKNSSGKKSSKSTSKSTTKFDYEKLSQEEKIEVNSIIDKVLSESIDEEGKNWKASFESRLSSSYDPTKDIDDETRTY